MQVVVHWACHKISASLQQPDDEVRNALTAKLQQYRGVRYSIIAGHAESVGRKGLATMLLEYETCAGDQVTHTALSMLVSPAVLPLLSSGALLTFSNIVASSLHFLSIHSGTFQKLHMPCG